MKSNLFLSSHNVVSLATPNKNSLVYSINTASKLKLATRTRATVGLGMTE
jgi:hypothetical protein